MKLSNHKWISCVGRNLSAPFTTAVLTVVSIFNAFAQTSSDTTRQLNEVIIRAHFTDQPLLKSTSSIGILTPGQLEKQQEESLVPAFNSIPGIRMEERSPGSYRLSIRGSLLRSPFGIRNVKIYLDEYAITDAGGNTYLNLLDAGTLNSITVLKGPEASIFGANTGGVVLIDPFKKRDSSLISASVTAGSYGLFHQKTTITKQWNNYEFNFNQGYQRSDGYRENSALNRNYASLSQKWQYSKKSQLRSTILFSDLGYETPGGLTKQQADLNPQLARQATATLPGAIEQHAGIMNQTWMGGIVNESQISQSVRHVISIFGSTTGFKNPFITNYEERAENSVGFRSFLEHTISKNNFRLISNVGLESQSTGSDIENYDNQSGNKGQLQSHDKLNAQQAFYFAHLSAEVGDRLTIESGTSINRYSYTYKTIGPVETSKAKKKFEPQWMPRFAISYLFTDNLSGRISTGRGYSPPTIAEVRASDNVINTRLEPETGWNYETGARLNAFNNRLFIDLSVFYFRLQDAVVRRVNDNDTEYFINAGGTEQKGLEAQLIQYLVSPNNSKFIRSLQMRNSFTASDFKFEDYSTGTTVFSGNRLTGVPRNSVISSLDFTFPFGFSLFAQHNYTSSIPLNDANSAYASKYHLVSLKSFWEPYPQRNKRITYQIFAGADNILNASYSLGNDLNAVGSRYYNPAPELNFYAGLSIHWK